MATSTRNPTSDVSFTGTWTGSAGSRFQSVDDHPDSGNTDSLTHGTTAGEGLCGFSAFSIPSNATNISVQVLFYAFKNGGGANTLNARIRCNDTTGRDSPDGNVTLGNGVANIALFTRDYPTNPKTAAAWTVDDVNGIGTNGLTAFGVISGDANPSITISSIQVQVTFTIPPLAPNQNDAVTVQEEITPRVLHLPQVGEDIVAWDLSNQEINYWITVTDDATVVLIAEGAGRSVNQNDEVTLADESTVMVLLQPQRDDAVTVADVPTINLLEMPQVADAVTVAEFAIGSPVLQPQQFESIAVAEDITPRIVLQPQPFETVTVAEDITPRLFIQPQTFDAITVTELGQALLPKLFVASSDDVTVGEFILVSTGAISTLPVDTGDSVTTAELTTVLLPKLPVARDDAVTVADASTTFLPFLAPSGTDAITAADAFTVLLPKLNVFSDDSVSAAEDSTLVRSGGEAPLAVSVFDLVILSTVEPIAVNAFDGISTNDASSATGLRLWSSVGSIGAAASKSANQSGLVLNTTADLEVGRVAVVLIAVDNAQTTDGDESAVTNLIDSAGNQYVKAREFTNGQGSTQAGACISVWYTKATVQLNAGQQITASFSTANNRDASAISVWKFALALDGSISVAASATLANDNADPGALNLTVANDEHLWIRAQAHERPNADTFTKSVTYEGEFEKIGTTGGQAVTNMTVAGEFDIFVGTSNSSNPAWSNAADDAGVLIALQLLPAASPSVVDSVAIEELAALRLSRLTIEADDPVTLQEIIQLNLGGVVSNIPVSTNDPVVLTDAVQLRLPKLFVSTFDAVTIVEGISLAVGFDFLFIETGENVAVSENIIFRGRLSISAFDLVRLFQTDPAQISVAESLTVTDSFGLIGGVTGNINLTVFEDVVVDIPEMHVAESLALAENIQITGTGIDWFSIGSLGSILSKSADQSSLVLQAQAVAAVGTVVVILIAVDNAGTTDGDEGAVTGISDQAGNTWQKIGEFANANAAAQTGAVISAWYSRISSQINASQLITATFSNPTLRDASALTAWNFGLRSSGAISVAAIATLANDNADPGSINLTVALAEHLWVRGQAHEGPLTDTWIKTTTYDAIFDKQGTTGGTNNTNMTVAGEFRIFFGTSNPSDPSWTAAADEAGIIFALKLSQNLAPNAADAVAVTDFAASLHARLVTSVFDSILAADVALLSSSLRVERSEDVTVADFSQATVRVFVTAVDSLALADLVALRLPLAISAQDLVTVADQSSLHAAIPVSAFDALSIADAATLLLPKLNVSAQDNIVVTDVSAVFAVAGAGTAAGDFVTVAEQAEIRLHRLTTDQFDSVTAIDFSALFVALAVSVNDPITVADQSAIAGNIQAEVFEQVTAADLAAYVFTPLVIPTGFELVTVADDAIARFPFLAATRDDSVSATEFASATLSLRISGDDSVTLADDVEVEFKVLTSFIEQGDTVSVLEEIQVHLPLFGYAAEAVDIDDDTGMFMPYHGAFAADGLTLEEFLRVVVGDFMDLQAQNDSVSLSDFAAVSFGRSDLIALTLRLDLRADLTSVYNDRAELTLEVMPDE